MSGLDLFRLNGERALITGSSRGLGSFIAGGLARAGAHVVIHGRDFSGAQAAADGLNAQGFSASACAFDVADTEAVAAGIAGLDAPVSVVVNNAGINLRHPLEAFPEADWRRVLSVHVDGAYHVAKAAAGPMLAAGRGKVINICSITSEISRPNIAAYATAKGGLKMLTKAMAVEWAGRGLQCNAIAPGFFATDMNQPLVDDPAFNEWVSTRTPAGRWGEPDDLVGAAIFLASRASNYVNGHMLAVDGGFLASM